MKYSKLFSILFLFSVVKVNAGVSGGGVYSPKNLSYSQLLEGQPELQDLFTNKIGSLEGTPDAVNLQALTGTHKVFEALTKLTADKVEDTWGNLPPKYRAIKPEDDVKAMIYSHWMGKALDGLKGVDLAETFKQEKFDPKRSEPFKVDFGLQQKLDLSEDPKAVDWDAVLSKFNK